MKHKFILSILMGVVLLASVFAYANINTDKVKAETPSGKQFMLPSHAVEVAPGVHYLGKAFDKDAGIVEGYAFFAKPTECNNDGVCQGWEKGLDCSDCSGGDDGDDGTDDGTDDTSDTSSCYDFIADGAKWRNVEHYMIDYANPHGLTESNISDSVNRSIRKWEEATGQEILGDEISGTVDGDSIGSEVNGQNELMFGSISDNNVIAVTIVWGRFGGNPHTREIVEWDQVYNNNFDWSANCSAPGEDCSSKMDFENIAIHELGHSVGMADLYEDQCSEMTMYGYGSKGETDKKTLEDGDINGVIELYNTF